MANHGAGGGGGGRAGGSAAASAGPRSSIRLLSSNGGASRVHRPRAPIMTIPTPIAAQLPPLRPPPLPVSLVAPRPENERLANEYVETPFRPPTLPTAAVPPSRALRPQLLPLPQQQQHHQQQQQHNIVTKQPIATFSKDLDCGVATASILCSECGRCRCESCHQPRPLPQKWICNNGCLVSADSCIDYASCLCCVKGMFYHCSDADGGDESCADDPCGCAPDRRRARWACLSVLSCVLPCLWLYWPLRGCKRVVEACYARHSRTGCRCKNVILPPTPEKRLLDSNSDF